MNITKQTSYSNTTSYYNRPLDYIVVHYTAGTTSRTKTITKTGTTTRTETTETTRTTARTAMPRTTVRMPMDRQPLTRMTETTRRTRGLRIT